jgi:predicted negative regulator of RcsB-dependent stress response
MKMKFSFVTVIIMGALVLTGWQFYRDSNGQKNNLSQVKVRLKLILF